MCRTLPSLQASRGGGCCVAGGGLRLAHLLASRSKCCCDKCQRECQSVVGAGGGGDKCELLHWLDFSLSRNHCSEFLAINVESFDEEKARELIDTMIAQRSQRKENLHRTNAVLRTKAEKNAAYAIELLHK